MTITHSPRAPCWGRRSCPDLSPGSQTLASVVANKSSWVPTVYVLVDPYQRLPEWDETNNLGSFGIIPNYPPEDLLLEQSGLTENQPAGFLAGVLTAVDRDDPDANGSYQFTLTTGEETWTMLPLRLSAIKSDPCEVLILRNGRIT